MRILVTGATGFLGAHVVHALLAAGDEVRALVHSERPRDHIRAPDVELRQGDLLDERSLKEACRGVDGLVHCAARMGFWSRQNEIQRAINVEGTTALYRAARKSALARIVHVSSVAAVGASARPEVLDESAAWGTLGMKVNYALTKRQGEERALAAARAGLPIVVVNPSALYGPRLDGGPVKGLVAAIARSSLPWVPPGGVSVADVADVAAATVAALRRGRAGERTILAGHNLTWRQLYEAIAAEVGGRVPRRALSLRGVRLRAFATGALDALHLSRPRWAPEIYRSYGLYSWYRSDKAARELGYGVRPLEQIVRRAAGLPA